MELVERLNLLARGDIRPDLTILFDCPVEVGLGRAVSPLDSTGVREDRFEQESLAFHRRVRDGYHEIGRQEPDRIRIIKADRTIDEVSEELFAVVSAGIGAGRAV